MRFLSVRPDFCRRLPSDSASQRTPLPLAICFPSLGRIRDFHPLEHARAGRTKRNRLTKNDLVSLFHIKACQKLLSDNLVLESTLDVLVAFYSSLVCSELFCSLGNSDVFLVNLDSGSNKSLSKLCSRN